MQRLAKVFGLALGASVFTGASMAHAQTGGSQLSRVAGHAADVQRAQGPRAYSALRLLWQDWEHGDPAAVEAALDSLEKSPRLAPELRVYTGLLGAYAKRRRGDLPGSEAKVRALGFLSDFWIAGPFDNEGKGGFDTAQGPESGSSPMPASSSWPGKERPVQLRRSPDVFRSGWVDMGSLVRPNESVCAFAVTNLEDGKGGPARPVQLWLGSGGAVRAYWNGKEVLADDKYRVFDADRLAADVVLQKGQNQLVVKVCGEEQGGLFSVRLAERDGRPVQGLRSPEVDTLQPLSRAAKPQAARGPLAAYTRMAQSQSPADWEQAARYLRLTHSDDLVANPARDLAAKAADRAPTIERLLLAGELAEDQNQQRAWIARAEKLVGPGTSDEARRAFLLAKAKLLRGGVNWRDSVPLYDELLARNPADDEAILARVELYNEAGLPATALAFLEKALAENPKNVLLLRAATLLLQEQGRGLEALETMERYAALRFDDPTFLRSNLQRQLARRDREGASRSAARLVATAPDNPSILAEASQAHVTLGDMATALQYAKRATELAPEDTDSLRVLADLHALHGQPDEQLALYRKILEIKPQDKTVRDYLAHREPSKPRADEAYARPAEEFLKKRDAAAEGQSQRTLLDLQVTTVFPNGLASRFRQVALQPLTDAAAAQARQYVFGYQADSEVVELRGARIHRKDGSIVDAVDTGSAPADNPEIAMYTSQRAYYVNFPRIDVGDVIEVRYRVEDVAHTNAFADYFGEVNYFESQEPVAHAEYVLITPKSRKFVFNQPKVPGLVRTEKDQGDSHVYRFVAENLPGQNREPLQPPGSELYGHVHVSTYQSWDAMGAWYWGLVRDQLVADDEVKRRVASITKGLGSDDAKVRAIYRYVVQNTRYVALEFGIHGYKPYRCAQIFARGYGDCKDKSALIVTMLKEAGIPATLVIVRTQMRGDFGTSPASLAPFDHAIAYVPSLDLYLDGTAEDTGSRELPAMDRNALALQVNEGKPKLVRLPDPDATASVTQRVVEADLSGKTAQLTFKADVSGVNASAWRRRYRSASSRVERIKEDLSGEAPGFETKNVSTSDLDDIESRVHVETKGSAPRLTRPEGDSESVSMGPREYLVRELAPLSARKRDLRIAARTTTITEWTVKLPAGASIERLPEAGREKGTFGWYAVDVNQKEPGVVHVRTEVAIDRSRVTAAEYPAFRAFCERVDHALGARLVFKRGGSK